MPETSPDQTELEKLLRNAKPWFEQNGTLLIYALAAVLAVAAGVVYVNRTPDGDPLASRNMYEALLGAGDAQGGRPEGFRNVADEHPNTKLADWAKLKQAETLFDDAVGNMFANREVGVELLQQTRTAYEQLSEKRGLSEEIQERVAIGLARVTETECDGSEASIKSAIDAWKQVASFDDGILTEHAEERIADLETPEAASWYKWFSEQTPAQVEPGLLPGQPAVPDTPTPSTDMDASDLPTLSPDEPATDDSPAAEPMPAEPEGTEPAEDKPEAKPAEADKPAATEKPAAEEKPAAAAEEKPTTEETPAATEAPAPAEKPAEEGS